MTAKRSGACLALLGTIFAVGAVTAATPARYARHAEIKGILQQLSDGLPVELKALPSLLPERPWEAWVSGHDSEIRARLAQGDEDTIINWLMFGTTFTTQPRGPALADTELVRRQDALIGARADDFLRALLTPGTDERRLFARRFFEGNGFSLTTTARRAELRDHLLKAVNRIALGHQQRQQELAAVRQYGRPTEILALQQRLYRDRGLSLDTELAPNYALDQSLAALKMRGLLQPGSVRRVAIVGAGLDFADKNEGLDFYPVQTVQPFAVLDSLRRLQLAPAGGDADIVALDISPRVINHVAHARAQAAMGVGYTLVVPLPKNRRWLPAFREYWTTFGGRIGVPAPAPVNHAIAELADVRAVRLSVETVRRLSAQDLNVVTERIEGQPFDLIIATNVLTYYDELDQALALANLASMLRSGGFLLSNTLFPEIRAVPIDLVEILETVYTSGNEFAGAGRRLPETDDMMWYQRKSDPLK